MDTFDTFVGRVVRSLNRSSLQYTLTGALASSYYGRPRTTLDVDVVVRATEEDLAELTEVLTSMGLKARDTDLRKAWRSQYRIITLEDRKSPHTLDIILTDEKLERKAGSILGLLCRTSVEQQERPLGGLGLLRIADLLWLEQWSFETLGFLFISTMVP